MDETDTSYMKRAIELARRGAGLVSPNPMVGAVLVNEGQVVGEGFHRYDRLRHAESYALEMAGERARGATLYCSLEPCCHHGRTPPCTEGLIEAKIARAIIAARDPDSRVSGQGIDQLRAAGIKVEVGLLESETVLLNEVYFKQIITGLPFIHSVVVRSGEKTGGASGWEPSPQFLESACRYDCIGLGAERRINEKILDACLTRERHRQLVIIARNEDARELIPDLSAVNSPVISVEPPGNDIDAYNSDLSLALKFAGSLSVTSVLTLPGFHGIDPSSILEQSDKLTVVLERLNEAEKDGLSSVCSGMEKDIELSQIVESTSHTELTGYRRRGGKSREV